MTQLVYKCLSWIIPYRVYDVDLALSYKAIADRLAQLESRGMQINSSSRFNQGT